MYGRSLVVFFFKPKTAYEMRISDWSSDVCSSDLLLLDPHVALGSDGSPGGSHPRSAGTFAKWIEEFVVRQPRVSIEEAVSRATSYPASIQNGRASCRERVCQYG